MNKIDAFWEWAEKELNNQGLNWYRVEKLAKVSNASISRRARERLPPTKTTCKAIADTFHLPIEYVFQKAGFIPPRSVTDEDLSEAVALFKNLDEGDRARILIMMRSLVKARQDTGK